MTLLQRMQIQLPNVGAVELGGIPNTRIYDARTNRWTQTGDMHFSRWYPSAVMLRDGKVFVASGVRKSQHNDQLSQVRRTETFDPRTGKWSENFTGPLSENSLPLYPRLRLLPNGKIFYDGSGQSWAPGGLAADDATWGVQQMFNLRTKQWEPTGSTTRNGTVRSVPVNVELEMGAPYRSMRILMAGGAIGPSPDSFVANPLSETYRVGFDGHVTMRPTGNLNHPRWASQGVLLPSGEVVAFNGSDKEEPFAPSTERAVRQAELYNPQTRKWRPVATSGRDRTYHNTAVLLPDARVLVGGHAPAPNLFGWVHDSTPVTANNERDASFEIYSPPYLFRGARPAIARVQRGIAWNRRFEVRVSSGGSGARRARTAGAPRIGRVVLSRLPAETHTYDNNARQLRLTFRQRGGRLTVQAPPLRAAPPGPYYLFVMRRTARGPVPSVARIVTVGRADARTARPLRFASADPSVSRGTATMDPQSTGAVPGECRSCEPSPGPAPQAPNTNVRRDGGFSKPFEEGGFQAPLCRRQASQGQLPIPGTPPGYIMCKPAAQTLIVLPDGRLLFWDGFPGTENSKAFILDGGDQTHNAQTRVMSLAARRATWTTPTPEDGGAVNPEIARGTVPDDAAHNDGDIFCSNQVHLADGRILAMGGTDWYTDNVVNSTPLGVPLG